MRFFKRIFFLSLIFVLGGCQNLPTRVFEKQEIKLKDGYQIPADAIVIDVRPPFEYAMSHLNGSISMQWEDFSQRTEPFRGLLELDLYFHARRLARHGIDPETKVVVVGKGLQGNGEEGRLAWTLKFMGLKNVMFTSIDSFNLPLTKDEAPPRENKKIWKPELVEDLQISRKDFVRAIGKRTGSNQDFVIIDVRPESEYLGKTSGYYSKKAPDLGAINIPWKEFMNEKGEPNILIKDRLKDIGLTEDRVIALIDDKGVRSAAVTLIMRELGFFKATNFSGGYMELLGKK